jgi:RNA polymerase sigma-70 factor (ECF subfamily)
MNADSASLILSNATIQPRAETMDRSELARELERLHADSWGWALACCGRDRELAEDALQTAYVRMLSARAKWGGGSSLRTWVFGVIRMTALEELRRRRVRQARDEDGAAAIDVADPAPGPDVVAEWSERSAALVAALDTLSPRQREVLQLVFYHGMTIEEAAAVMNVSLGSARTHYDRGKKALAQLLTQEHAR